MARSDDTDFARFVETHASSLRRSAYLLTGSQQAAEDLLQDTLLKAWLAWRRIEPSTALAYVRRIMVNLMNDRWRKKRYETVTIDIDDRRSDPNATKAFAQSDERNEIVRHLASLTVRERTAVVLRYYHDLPDSEVAEIMGVSTSTVKSTCSRALAAIRARAAAAETTRGQHA